MMFSTIRSKMLALIIGLMVFTLLSLLLVTNRSFQSELSSQSNRLARETADSALRVIESEYHDLISFEIDSIKNQRFLMENLGASISSMMEALYSLQETGEITEKDAQESCLQTLKDYEYQGKRYFLVFDLNLVGISHPKKEMVGKKWVGFEDLKKRDALDLIRKTIVMEEKMFSVFMWPRLEDMKPVKQLGFFFYFPRWKWIVGTTLELSEIEKLSQEKELVTFSRLNNILREMTLNDLGGILVFDSDGGTVVETSNRGDVHNERAIEALSSSLRDSRLTDTFPFDNAITYRYNGKDKKEIRQMAYVHYYKYKDWFVAAFVDENSILEPVSSIVDRQVMFLVMILLAGIFFAILISGKISSSIARLAEYANEIPSRKFKSGRNPKLDTILSTHQNNETKQLARAFCFMESELGKTIQHLEIYKEKLEKLVDQRTEELRIAKDRYKLLFDNAPLAIALSDSDGRIMEANKAAFDLTGYSPEERYGSNAVILYKNIYDREQLLEDLAKHGVVRGREITLVKKNGENRLCRFTSLGLDIDNQTLLYIIIEDITYQKKIENEKSAIANQLQKAQKMEAMGLMASGVAHDLNNILSGIVGYPDLMLQTLPQDSNLRKPLTQILESGQRAAVVVADLLTIVRGVASVRSVVDLNVMTQEYLDSPEAKKNRSLYPSISFQYENHAEKSSILCSPVHIQKCIMNIVTNAAEAISDSGTVQIILRNIHLDDKGAAQISIESGSYVELAVCDDGPGISEFDIDHIFEPFYTRKKLGRSGTGLGLTVVWNTMQDHKGNIRVESREQGTCFKLYFPVQNEHSLSQQEYITEQSLTGQSEKILIVDDEPVPRDVASNILMHLGYTVEAVCSGEEAIRYCEKNTVDVVLLDMIMEPGINGYQTYKELLKINSKQKAIIASGFSESTDVKAALHLGASEYIKKPYSMDQLGSAVKQCLFNTR